MTISAQARDARDEQAIFGETEGKARARFRLGRAHYDNRDFAQAYLKLETNIDDRAQLSAPFLALERSLAERATLASEGDLPDPAAVSDDAGSIVGAETESATETSSTRGTTESPWSPPLAACTRLDRTCPVVFLAAGGVLVAGAPATGIAALGSGSDLVAARDRCKAANDCNSLSSGCVSELDSMRAAGETFAIVSDVLLFGGIAAVITCACWSVLVPARDAQADSVHSTFHTSLS